MQAIRGSLLSSSRWKKQPDIDTVKLTREVEAALSEIGATLPAGVKADQVLFRQANFIETSIGNVQKVLVEAIVVVAIILFVFLLNTRTTAISLTAIPVSILVTAIVFHLLGLSINTMTLGGLAIAIGELVDDAVVDVENIFRRLRENRGKGQSRSVFDVVVSASQEVRSGIVYATMIIVLVFVPIVCPLRYRGAALRAAWPGLYHLHPCLARGVDHAHPGHGLLHAARPEASGRA